MLLNRYIALFLFAGVFSVLSLYFTIQYLDPVADRPISLIFFFISFFFTIGSLTSLMGYSIRILLYRHELLINHFNISLRQGILTGLFASAAAGLQAIRTLNILSLFILLGITILLELHATRTR